MTFPFFVLRKIWRISGSGTERRLFASPLRVPLYLIRKGYRRTSFCVTLKGATLSYPQGYQAWLSFLFSASLLFFFRRYGEFVVFSAGKVRNTYSFLWLRYADIVKRQRKGWKRKITEGRITVLLSLTSEPAIFPEPKDGNLRRWGFKGTSERLSSITLMDMAYSGFLFGISFCTFLRILMG